MWLNRRATGEFIIGLLIIAVVSIIVLWPCLFGKIPVNSAGIFRFPPWEDACPSDTTPENIPSPGLSTTRYVPWHIFMHYAATHNMSLLWNPYERCGMPFFALWETRCLSPFSLPFYLVDTAKAEIISALSKLITAGLCAYFLAFGLGFSTPMALVVALAFELSGAILGRTGFPFSDAAAWFPLLLLFADRLGMGRTEGWPWATGIFALILLGGDLSAAAGMAIICGLFVFFRILLRRTALAELPVGLMVLTGIILGSVLLTAIQVVPFLEFISQGGNIPSASSAGWSHGAREFIRLIFPRFFEDRACSDGAPDAAFLYSGILPLLFLPLWFSIKIFIPKARHIRIQSLLITLLCVTVASWILQRYGHMVPVIHFLRPSDLLLANPLILAIVAAETADEWVHLNAEDCIRTIKRFLGYILVWLCAAVTMIYWVCLASHPDDKPLYHHIILFCVWVTVIIFLLGITLVRPSVSLMGYGMALIIFLDTGITFASTVPYSSTESFFPESSFIRELKHLDTRVSGSVQLKKWPLAGNLIPQTFGTSGYMTERQQVFTERLEKYPLMTRQTGSHALLLTRQDIRGGFAPVRKFLRIKHVFPTGAVLFDDLEAHDRAWVTHSTREIKDFHSPLIIPNREHCLENIIPPPNRNIPDQPADITEITNTCVKLHFAKNPDGVLILTDTWYPGWEARDSKGKKYKVFPVDGIWRGVLLDEDTQDITFQYTPFSFRLGMEISVFFAIILILFGIRNGIRALRRTW